MSSSSPRSTATRRVLRILRSLPFDPVVTGSLLLALTRSSASTQAALLKPFENNILSRNPAGRIATAITVLKVLLTLGLTARLNAILNYIAFNNWYIHPSRRPGPAWQFGGPGDKEIVLITGGCSGIGLQLVKDFAGKAIVVVVDVQPLPAELAALPNVHFYTCDLSGPASPITALCALITSEVGPPSVLINNAGIGHPYEILTAPADGVSKLIHVNLISHFTLINALVPAMVQAQKGHIVTIASAASYVTVAGMADYAATKAGVLALHETLSQELRVIHKAPGVLTTIVHPSWTDTAIVAPVAKQLRRAGAYIQPTSAVTTPIVEAVMAGRGARIFVPESAWTTSLIRAFPFWLQDWARSSATDKMATIAKM